MAENNNTQQYPPWFIKLLQDVLDMRDAQGEYFKHQNKSSLAVSIHKESVVDNKLTHFVKQGIIHHKQKPNTRQKELF